MGRMKDWLIEQQERGYYFVGDKYVCSDCIQEPAVQAFIEDNLVHNECSYCGNKSSVNVAAHIDKVIGFIATGLTSEWDDPVDGLGWEGSWVGEVYDTYDVLDDAGLEVESHELRGDLIEAFGGREWCRKGFYAPTQSEVLSFGWDSFVRLIKHKARYVFMRYSDTEEKYEALEDIPPHEFLDSLGNVLDSLDLCKKLSKGKTLHRVRLHAPNKNYNTAKKLGPPPIENCIYANRMSPAGISMFYGAFDIETCIIEIYNPECERTTGTAGVFETTSDMLLLDLSRLPTIPSVFEEDSKERRHNLLFLRGFMDDFTQPIKKDGYEHVEYVPTQVVTEYIRHIYRHSSGASIDGILYPSAKAKGKTACVLFIDNDSVDDPGEETSKTRMILRKASPINVKDNAQTLESMDK